MLSNFDYTIDDIRPLIAQWNLTLSDSDLEDCSVGGKVYNRALAELHEALVTAGYNPTVNTPIAYQRCRDILALGIALYFIEGRSTISYTDGFNPITSAFSRYRNQLRDIAAGNQLGELSQKAKYSAVSYHSVRRWH